MRRLGRGTRCAIIRGFRFATPEVRRDDETLVVFVGGSTWAPCVVHEPGVMPSTSGGVPYFAPSWFVIAVLAALALRMSVTRAALACLAAELLWVAAAATIAFRSARPGWRRRSSC